MSVQQKGISEQHIPLIEGRWLLWRWAALRGSGFPIQRIELLSSPESAQAADRYLEAEAHAEETRQSLLAALRSALQELRISSQWEQSPQRRQLLKGISSVNKGKPPKECFPFALEVEAALEQWQLALAETQQLHDKARRIFEQELEATTVALLDLVRDHRFIEAVLWQNRRAYRSGILPLLEQQKQATLKRNVQYRNRELLLVRYLHVFLRVSTEGKPIFVDFDSRLLVRLLNRTIHQACEEADQAQVSVTEMLPAVDEVWLPDAEGNRYTCELRLVAVDQAGSGLEEDWGIL